MNHNFSKLKTHIFVIVSLLVWYILLFFCIKNNNISPYQENITAGLEIIFQLSTTIILTNSYINLDKNTDKENRYNFLFFLFMNISLFITSLLAFTSFYLSEANLIGFKQIKHLQDQSYHSIMLFYVPHMIYAILSLIFFTKLIKKNKLKNKKLKFQTTTFFIITFSCIILYVISLNYTYNILNNINIWHTMLLLIDYILFNVLLLGLIYAETINAFLVILAGILIVTGRFFVTYEYILNTSKIFFITGEFLIRLGFLFLLFNALNIKQTKAYSIIKWFRNDTSIKTSFIFSIYSISMISFFIIHLIIIFFEPSPKILIILYPLTLMMYAVIVILVSIFIGKKFEKPFQLIRNNINEFLKNPTSGYIEKQTFEIEEFQYLQQFMINWIEEKNKTSKLYLSFSEISAQAIHDLGSPLLAINKAIKDIEAEKNNATDFLSLAALQSQVKSIISNLLFRYRELTKSKSNIYTNTSETILDVTLPKYINIVKLINESITNKSIEWQNKPCNIKLITLIDYPMFFCDSSSIIRIVSNLLNNAYESLSGNEGNIIIYLKSYKGKNIIEIQDSGSGIAKEKIDDALHGISSKHMGNGLGLSSAVKYMKSIGGNLTIISELNKGTIISLTFPFNIVPDWLPTKIFYKPTSTFIIVDDDPSIHSHLQLRCKRIGVKSLHFIDTKMALDCINNFIAKDDLLCLVDLNLNSTDYNGFELIDIIAQKIDKSSIYLITFDSENIKVQDYVKEHNIQLIPKEILSTIQFYLKS